MVNFVLLENTVISLYLKFLEKENDEFKERVLHTLVQNGVYKANEAEVIIWKKGGLDYFFFIFYFSSFCILEKFECKYRRGISKRNINGWKRNAIFCLEVPEVSM